VNVLRYPGSCTWQANTLRDLHASSRKTAVDRSKVREAARRYIGKLPLVGPSPSPSPPLALIH
jgi:hypothetical protein